MLRSWSISAFFVLVCCSIPISPISYSVEGTWTKATKSHEQCTRFMCSPLHSYLWNSTSSSYRLYNNITACSALINLGVKKIFFYGDSYMRHIYAAVLITLNGDYVHGSLEDPSKGPHCKQHALFNEKSCNLELLNRRGVVCDGRLVLDASKITHDIEAFTTKDCSADNGTVALFSFGNHPLKLPRYGINDPKAYQDHFLKTICPTLIEHKHQYTGRIGLSEQCSSWWVSTHYRLLAKFPDEEPAVVEEYNTQMRSFFESGACGNVNYIDVYNMTKSILDISRKNRMEPTRLSWDLMHWGYEVNLVKAQIVINALVQSQS